MTPLAPSSILILGGRSLVAPYLMDRLQKRGLRARLLSRRPQNLPAPFMAEVVDITGQTAWKAPAGSIVISLLPLWILADSLPRLRGVRHIVAVGSTSLYGKAVSQDPKERALAERLAYAEKKTQSWCAAAGVKLTLLRATMIYDGHTDKNIARIAQTARRFHAMPLAAPATGLRQPIHADDVAACIMGALCNPLAYGRALNIAGGEILTYRELCARVFVATGNKPRFIMLNPHLLKWVFQLGMKTGILRENSFGFGVFARMNQDLVFPCAGTNTILGVVPRGFRPEL